MVSILKSTNLRFQGDNSTLKFNLLPKYQKNYRCFRIKKQNISEDV